MASILESLAANAIRTNKESSHQRALFCWAHDNESAYPELKLLFSIPNGGERPKSVAGAMVAEGAKDGVPDTFLAVPRGKWHGLFVELKRLERKDLGHKAGVVKPEQKDWHAALMAQGYGVAVAYGWEAARAVIVQYLEYKSDEAI